MGCAAWARPARRRLAPHPGHLRTAAPVPTQQPALPASPAPPQGAKSQLSLLNIITELKKCCNHPFLFQTAEVGGRAGAAGWPPGSRRTYGCPGAACRRARHACARALSPTPAKPNSRAHAQEEYRLKVGGDDDVARRLVLTSGKMVLLDKLLTRLRERGHRCDAWAFPLR